MGTKYISDIFSKSRQFTKESSRGGHKELSISNNWESFSSLD